MAARQRAALIDLPKDEASILYHYTLSDEDIEHINVRRRSENRFGYALQLCALRYPGRLLSSREVIPESVVRFIGAQLGMTGGMRSCLTPLVVRPVSSIFTTSVSSTVSRCSPVTAHAS